MKGAFAPCLLIYAHPKKNSIIRKVILTSAKKLFNALPARDEKSCMRHITIRAKILMNRRMLPFGFPSGDIAIKVSRPICMTFVVELKIPMKRKA